MSTTNAVVTATAQNAIVHVKAGSSFSVDIASLFPGVDPASVHVAAKTQNGVAISDTPDWRFAVWGDSVATGAGVSDLAQSWRTLVPKSFAGDASLYMGAFGGATTSGATTAFTNDGNAAAHRSAINIFWTGHNDADVEQTVAGLKQMVSQLTGEQHYLIVLPMQGSGNELNSPGYLKIVEAAQAIRAAFPAANIVDVQSAMTAAAPNDPFVAEGRVPSKFLADVIHPNAAGQAVIAETIEAAVKANGWTGANPTTPTWMGTNGQGTLSGAATSDDTGSYTLAVTAQDASGHTLTKTVSLVVDPNPVTAAADTFAAQGNAAVQARLFARSASDSSLTTSTGTALHANVLDNDTTTDASGKLTAALVDGPAHGRLSFSADGSFVYVPNAGYVGPDSFTYKASSGIATSEPTTVSLEVAARLDTLTVRVSADSYLGNPHFGVLVDGKVAGFGVATAQHAGGAWQDFTFKGDFGSDPSKIQVVYENDRWEGDSKDRNLYVDRLDLNGVRYEAEDAQLLTYGWSVTGGKAIGNAGALQFDIHAQAGTVLPTPAPTVPAVIDTPAETAPTPPVVEATPVASVPAPSPAPVETPVASTPAPSAPVVLPTPASPVAETGHADDGLRSLTLRVSEDAYQGHAQFVVTVDGKQVGDVQTVTASHAAGASQDITVKGAFSASPESVAIKFVNDLWGGSADQDRNLYVESLTLDGVTHRAEAAHNTAGATTATGVVLWGAGPNGDGALTFDTAPDALTVRVSEDAYQGHAQFVVTVDGKQVGGVQTVTASRAAGEHQDVTVKGDFGSGAGAVAIKFVNDLWGGSADQDRNLYVDSLTMNGKTFDAAHATNTAGTGAALLGSSGDLTFNTAPDTLVLRVSEDAYHGDAQFVVTVDGKQFGGVQTVTASHAAGAHQDITLHGTLGAAPGSVAVHFVNDLYGGSPDQDRNLYVESLTMNGHTISATHADNTAGLTTATEAALLGAGPTGNGALTFDMLHV